MNRHRKTDSSSIPAPAPRVARAARLLTPALLGATASVAVAGGAGPIFAPQVMYGTGTFPQDVAALDVNGDGAPDILAPNRANDQVSILINTGDGTLAPEVRSPTIGDGPVDLAIADFDNDLIADVATADLLGDTVSILFNTHSGNLTAGVTFAVGTEPTDIIASDFNGDGNADLAVCNALGDSVTVALGHGDGTFTVLPEIGVGDEPLGLGAMDVNNDGDLDLVVANASGFSITVLLGNGAGGFAAQPAMPTPSRAPYAIEIADVNGDGLLDAVAPSRLDNVVMTFLNNGAGALTVGPESPAGSSPRSLAVAEFTNDLALDIVTTNYIDDEAVLLIGNGDGTFQAPIEFPSGDQPEAVLAADLDTNGDPDFVIANRGDGSVSVFINLLNPQAQRVFWSGGGDQTFTDPMNWLGMITPAVQPSPIVFFDESVADFGQNEAIVFTQDEELVGLRVASGDISVNLNSSDLTLTGFLGSADPFTPLEVGFPLDQPDPDPFPALTPSLRVTNTAVLPSTFDTRALAVGRTPGSAGAFVIDSSGASMTVRAADGVLVGGAGDGELRLQSSLAELRYGSSALSEESFVVGGTGAGSLLVFGGAITAEESIGRVTIGEGAGSFGEVRLSGAASSWSNVSGRFVIADEGVATFDLLDGAQVVASATSGIELARAPGSFATLTLAGAGTAWSSPSDVMTVGVAGDATLTIGDGGTLNVFTLINTATGDARASGVIDGDVVNFGRLTTRTPSNPDGLATLTVTGDYDQFDDPVDPEFSGMLQIGVSTSGGQLISGRLDVGGAASLSGGLVLEADTALDIVAGEPDVLDATLVAGRFDVAFFPAVTPGPGGEGRFLRVRYNNALLGTGETVSVFVDALAGVIDTDPAETFGVNGQPVAAALGDLNNDGLVDLVLAVPDESSPGTMPGSVVVLFNAGTTGGAWDGFAGGAQVAVGVDPSGVALGDADLDGGLDIAVTNRADGTAMILRNDGTGLPGSIAVSQVIAVGSAPSALSFGNLNEDAWADLAVANFGSNDVSIFENLQGVGGGWMGVGPAQTLPAGDGPIDLIFADLDEDKWDDVAVANANDGTVTYLDNAFPPGQFDPPVVLGSDTGSSDLARADLNGDGVGDLIVANPSSDTVSIILNNGDSTFEPVVNLPLDGAPRSVAPVDLDDDADLDLAVIADDGLGAPAVRVLRNDLTDGQLIFSPDADIDAGGAPLFVLAGDVDLDGQGDLVTVNTAGSPLASTGAPAMPIGVVRQALACPGDCDGSGAVDFNDLVAMLFEFGEGTPACDADASGTVDFNDLVAALFLFGPCT